MIGVNVNHPYTKGDIAIIFDMIDFLGLDQHKYENAELKTQVVLEIYMTIIDTWSRMKRSDKYMKTNLSDVCQSEFAIDISEKILSKYNIPTA